MPTSITYPATGLKHSETPTVTTLGGDESLLALRPQANDPTKLENVNVPVALLGGPGGGPGGGAAAGFAVRAYGVDKVVISLPPGLPRTQATIDNLLRMQVVPKAPQPASYDTTLDASNPVADGAYFVPAGPQKLGINERVGGSGSTNSYTLVDSSDNNSSSSADMRSDYVGDYFQFERKDGKVIKATWPATAQVITL
jgi:hypothetical protein